MTKCQTLYENLLSRFLGKNFVKATHLLNISLELIWQKKKNLVRVNFLLFHSCVNYIMVDEIFVKLTGYLQFDEIFLWNQLQNLFLDGFGETLYCTTFGWDAMVLHYPLGVISFLGMLHNFSIPPKSRAITYSRAACACYVTYFDRRFSKA